MLPDHLFSDLVCAVLFAGVLVLVVAFGTKIVDRVWTKLDLEDQVQKGNIAAGIVMAATVIGFCLAVAIVFKGILGG